MYGTQTFLMYCGVVIMFENDVKMYGTQTCASPHKNRLQFENDVKMYGTQTYYTLDGELISLRMM